MEHEDEMIIENLHPDEFYLEPRCEDGKIKFALLLGEDVFKAVFRRGGFLMSFENSYTPYGAAIAFRVVIITSRVKEMCRIFDFSDKLDLAFLEQFSSEPEYAVDLFDFANKRVYHHKQEHDVEELQRLKECIEAGVRHNASLSSIDFDKAIHFAYDDISIPINI